MLYFAAGVLGFTFIEYVHHRHGGHLRWMGEKVVSSHRAHHIDPLDGGATYLDKLRYRAPLVCGVCLVLGVPLVLALGGRDGGLVSAGLLAGYAYSEWFHNRMHQRAPRSRVGRWMWRFHYVHHYIDTDVNFGFSTPLWDYVFRTARTYDEVPVPHVMAPPDMVDGAGFRLVGRPRADS